MDEKIKVLDLFSGLGGFTSGFDSSLFDVTHVDNCSMEGVHGNNVQFKMNCNKFLREHKQKKYDIVLGGPPCMNIYFSIFALECVLISIFLKAQHGLGLDFQASISIWKQQSACKILKRRD